MGSRVEYCLIADDHAMMRAALAGTVRLIWPDANVTAVGTFPDAMAGAATRRFDLILCDLSMPGAQPIEGVAALMGQAAGAPILIITGSEDDEELLTLLDMGVAGFLHKTASGEVVEAAITLVAAGGRYLPPRLLDLVRSGEQPAPPREKLPLTARQTEVLTLLAKGASNKEIARELTLSPATVKVHVAALLAALNARNRSEVVSRAYDNGWIKKA